MLYKFLSLWVLCGWLLSKPVLANDDAWRHWQEGRAVLLLRHSLAPGTGDPAGLVIGDCNTQRNLNEQGRAQAAGWHSLLASHTSSAVAVYSSPWCRCVETATLINLGPVTTVSFLGSFFAGRGDGEQYTADTRQWLNQLPPGKPIVVVTHQVNITALTGIYPRSNEGILVALPITNKAEVLARLH